MDTSSPDWDFVTSNHASARRSNSESPPRMHPTLQQGLQNQVCPDQSLLETCKAVKDFFFLTAGYYTQEVSAQRNANWASRPPSSHQDSQTTQALLSILSHGATDAHMRHNLTLFARCIEVLGYSAKTIVVISAANPQIETIWSIRSTNVQRHQSFLRSTKEYVVEKTEKSRNMTYPLTSVNTTVIVFVIAPDNKLPQQSNDSITYVLSAQQLRQTDQLRNAPGRPGQETDQFIQSQSLPPLRNPAIILPPLSQIDTSGITAAQAPSRMPAMSFQPTAATYGTDMSDFAAHPSSVVSPDFDKTAVEQLQVPQEQQHFMFKTPTASHPRRTTTATPYWPARPTTSLSSLGVLGAQTTSSQLPLPSLGGAVNAVSMFSAPTPTNFVGPSRRGRGDSEIGASRRKCSNCGTTNTRQWVRGEQNLWLCHSCGQFWRKNGYGRPAALWNRPTFKRSRRKTTASGRTAARQPEEAQQLQHLPVPYVGPVASRGVHLQHPSTHDNIFLSHNRIAPLHGTFRSVGAPLATSASQSSNPTTTAGLEQFDAQGSTGIFPEHSSDPTLFRDNL